MNASKDGLVRRVFPELHPVDSVEEIPLGKGSTLSEEQVRTGFQQLFPGADTTAMSRMEMLRVMGRHNLKGI